MLLTCNAYPRRKLPPASRGIYWIPIATLISGLKKLLLAEDRPGKMTWGSSSPASELREDVPKAWLSSSFLKEFSRKMTSEGYWSQKVHRFWRRTSVMVILVGFLPGFFF